MYVYTQIAVHNNGKNIGTIPLPQCNSLSLHLSFELLFELSLQENQGIPDVANPEDKNEVEEQQVVEENKEYDEEEDVDYLIFESMHDVKRPGIRYFIFYSEY